MYTQPISNYVITSGNECFSPLLLGDKDDWESFTESDIPAYFDDVHQQFVARIMELRSISSKLTHDQQKELVHMLDALIQAKLFLQDHQDGSD